MFIRVAHRNRIESAQDVGLHHGELGDAVDAARVAQLNQVEPAATAWTSGGGAVFAARFAQRFAGLVEEFSREGSATDTGAVRLEDPDHFADAAGSHAQTIARAGGDGVGGGDEGVGAEVDVQHRSLGAFRQDAFASVEGFIQEVLGVDELELAQFLRSGEPFRFYAFEVVLEVGVLGEEAEVLGAQRLVTLLELSAGKVAYA